MAGEKLTKEQERAFQERTTITKQIVQHKSPKKVIVAGPGTGKTFLFKEIFASKAGGKRLTLTFINNLVDDLSLELRGISEVRTLHGFALKVFRGGIKIFPGLPDVIAEDGEALLGEKVDFKEKIHNLDDGGGYLDFYHQRRKYYDHFGYSDIILGLVRLFEQNPKKIPKYQQVVVDEFQDFNKLEVALIEQLSQQSPVVIAGDDDQAIYEFKSSNPEFIRTFFGTGRSDFTSFTLPFCSRSTKVIVDAVNDLVLCATKEGLLKERVLKKYLYFPSPVKDRESTENPKIVYKRIQDTQIPWFIEKEIGEIAEALHDTFEVLIISPYSSQCIRIGKGLQAKGLTSVRLKEPESEKLPYLEGLHILLKDRKSNLGWRIVGKALLSKDDFLEALVKSKECSEFFQKLLGRDTQQEVLLDIQTLRTVLEGKSVKKEAVSTLLENLGYQQDRSNRELLRLKVGRVGGANSRSPGLGKIPITVTTVQGSKGLSADYVFITHLDRRYMGKNDTPDQSLRKLLVALTRARTKVWLLPTTDGPNPFLRWIHKDRIEFA